MLPDQRQRVAPFGHLRINACLRLPEAYRSLLRPSSPVETEASTVQLLVAYLQRTFSAKTHAVVKERIRRRPHPCRV